MKVLASLARKRRSRRALTVRRHPVLSLEVSVAEDVRSIRIARLDIGEWTRRDR